MANFIFYDANAPKKKGGKSPKDANPHEYWLRHFGNALTLTFLAREGVTFEVKAQARAELDIAERKMAHWQRHEDFDVSSITGEIAALRRQRQGAV